MRFWYSFYAAFLVFMFKPPSESADATLNPLFRYFLTNWQHWDAIWYLRIAIEGYGISDGRSVFPPMYPLFIRWSSVVLNHPFLGAMLISTLAGAGATILIYIMTSQLLGPQAGELTTLVLIFFPTATFFFGAYTEPVFLLFVLGMFLAAQRDKFGLAGFLAILATLTRLQGVVLVLPLCWMAWTTFRKQKQGWYRLLAATTPVLALVIFSWIRNQWIDPTPIDQVYETYWKSKFGFPGESILASLRVLPESLSVLKLINWLDFGLLMLMISITPVVIVQLPPPLWLYHVGMLIILLLRIGPPDNPLQGMSRYMILMFPAHMVIANWAIPPLRKRFLLSLMALMSTWILTVFMLGLGWVG